MCRFCNTYGVGPVLIIPRREPGPMMSRVGESLAEESSETTSPVAERIPDGYLTVYYKDARTSYDEFRFADNVSWRPEVQHGIEFLMIKFPTRRVQIPMANIDKIVVTYNSRC